MTKVTFYGGVKEIGGNKILVEDRDTKIFLDFGMSFGALGEYYEEFLAPRTAGGMKDFLEMSLLPDLKGVYRSDHLKHIGREPEECEIDACFVTHAHADHVNYVSFLNEEIPIYCGETCYDIIDAITESGGRRIDFEVLNFKERPIKNYRKEAIKRDFNTFRTGDRIKVGSIEVEPIHVDHSVPGAYGYILYTSDETIAYTGDIRLHGAHSEMTKDFIDKCSSDSIDALITEGTRINEKKTGSEERVYKKSGKAIKDTDKLVISDFNFKDVDRARTFYKLAKENGRKFAIGYKEACLLKRYSKDKKLEMPSLDDENIVIFKKRKRTGTYEDRDYKKAERSYYEGDNIMTAEEIKKNQSDLIVFLNFWNFGHMIDIQPEPGSVFVHSLSEPFNEEMAISHEREEKWIEHFKLEALHAHCSGHASGPELKEEIEKINAKKIFPIHTEHPGMFRALSSKTKMVKYAKEYEI